MAELEEVSLTAEQRLRETEAELTAARLRQKDALIDWRQKHNPRTAVALAFATDEAERLADEFEDAQTDAHAEYFRLQMQLERSSRTESA